MVRKFSSPPREQDLQPLRWSRRISRNFPACMPGACSLKLSPKMMEQFQEKGADAATIESLYRATILHMSCSI